MKADLPETNIDTVYKVTEKIKKGPPVSLVDVKGV